MTRRKAKLIPLFLRAGFVLAMGTALTIIANLLKRVSFRGRVVLITGGSRGLGLVLARQLGREGAQLMLLARDQRELDRAAAQLRSLGIRVQTISGDVRDPSTAQKAVAATIGEFGRLDMLINNAGVIIVGPLENMTEADFEMTMAIHFWAPWRFMNEAIPYLRRTQGRIVNISSIGGKVAVPHLAPYSASKFALAGLSNAFRAELAKDGIKVTSVFPGLMRTGSHIQALFKGRRDREFAWFALGAATPLSAISAERAARQIISASRRGAPQLVISMQARLAILAEALFPTLSARIAALVNSVLPEEGSRGTALPGWQVRGSFPPKFLSALSDRASRANNEL